MTAPPDYAALCARLRDIDASMDAGWANDTMEEAADALEACAMDAAMLDRAYRGYKAGIVQSSNGVGYVDVFLEYERAAIDRARGEA